MSDDYLLDTNILRYWYDAGCPENSKVAARVQAIRQADPQTHYASRVFISAVTVGEIEFGHRVNPTPDVAKQSEYLVFVREECPERLEITEHVGEHYGQLKGWLFERFSPKGKRAKANRPEELINPTTGRELGVDENDIWIAAQAMTFNLVLVTHDSRGHFGDLLNQFGGRLRVVDWAR
jgi:predicted nucleic acid-binding protein